jgi:hypothetical protein
MSRARGHALASRSRRSSESARRAERAEPKKQEILVSLLRLAEERGDLEHLAGALAVVGGHDRRGHDRRVRVANVSSLLILATAAICKLTEC